MSNNSEPNINWDPYIQDITSVYITQNKTAEETIQYLRKNHGLQVTLRQFKYKFGGKKHITEKEWTTGIIPAIQKRKQEHKESDVYFHRDKLNPKRVKRGVDRYSAEVSQDIMDLDTSTVIGKSLSDRLCITTPPCHSASSPINPNPEVYQDVTEATLPRTPAQIMHFISPSSLGIASPSRRSCFFLQDDGDSFLFNFDDSPQFLFGTPTAPIEHIPEAHVQGSLDHALARMSSDGLFGSSGVDTLLGVAQFTLIFNLPYFQLKHHIPQNTSSPGIVDHFYSGFSPDGPSSNESFDIPTNTDQPSNDLPSMLAKVIGFPYNGQIADAIPSFVTKLRAVVPERYPGELNTQVEAFSDPSQKPLIFQLFEVAAYFCSNNMLQRSQVVAFAKWVIEHNHAKSLILFLRLRRDMLTVKAFIHSLVEAGASMKKQEFLKQLHAIGAKFDHVAAELVEINDSEFQMFVLSTADPELLKGESGGELLRSVARTQNIEAAEVLIQAGAKVNVSLSDKVPTSPLVEAISYDNFEMVKCLVRAGADVNKGYADHGHTPLSMAVYKENKRLVEYLLDQNVAIEDFVSESLLLQDAKSNNPDIYKLLLKKSGRELEVTTDQLIQAASSDARILLEFLSQHSQVSERMLEEAMVEALVTTKTQAVINFLQHGVDPNGSHIPISNLRPLSAATTLNPLSYGLEYTDLLIHAKADVNIAELEFDYFQDEEFNPVAEKLVDAGLDLTRYGPIAIEEAAKYRNTDVLVLLINKGSSVNSYGHRFTPFQAVALRESLELLQYLFKKGAEVNKPAFPIRGYTALQAAAKACSIEKIQYLLSVGADINAPPAVSGGATALEATVRPEHSDYDSTYEWYDNKNGFAETFIFLRGEGAAANRPDGSNSPLLHYIIERKNTHLLKLALDAGANTNHRWQTRSSSQCERTPLQLAAEKGQVDAVKLLLDYQADPNASPAHHHGKTALQAAASSETACMETVELLLNAGAAINAEPAAIGGISALQGAAIKGHFQIAMLLIEKGAIVNAPPAIKDGRTAIEGAAEHGRLDMVQMLLNAGAVGDVIRKTGFKKAISLARENRHFAVVDLLESH
ncbi:hypothetical protein MKX08_007501 [Trichoderma sp. CBMAI-0020]|nr:hypothetical protein MKX08_007501 [Trichoderma sp. CBMAI-0020]